MSSNQSADFKNSVFGAVTFIFIMAVTLGAAELLVRLKNSDQKNYNIEMWRYSKLLKKPSSDPRLGHEHQLNKSARLEGVQIRLNRYGMRGADPDLSGGKKKILILGSSNTLGWGVPEEDTMAAQLQKDLGSSAVVMNAGIGNYNALRYVTLFESKLRALHPDVVIVHYFIRDAEVLPPGRNNFLLRNSELAALLYQLAQQQANKTNTVEKLTHYYEELYRSDAPGFLAMKEALSELKRLSQEDGFKVIVAMAPEIHQMKPYPFAAIHQKIAEISKSLGWTFVDLYEPLSAIPAEKLWAMPGDPHINATGHRLMAAALKPYLDK